MKKINLMKIIYKIYLIFSIAIILVLCGEIISRDSMFDVYSYISARRESFIFTVILCTVILILMYCLFNNIGIATIIVGIFYIGMHTIDFYKYRIKGEHISPYDLNLLSEAINISGNFKFDVNYGILWSIFCLIWLSIISLYKINLKMQFKTRIKIGALSSIILVLLTLVSMNNYILSQIGIRIQPIYVSQNYVDNGLLIGFINRYQEFIVDKPENYTEENVLAVLDKSVNKKNKDINYKPNIIMVMSEAFIDVNQFPNIELSENPIEFFNKVQEEFTNGNIITAIFGGSTAQTEYEVLTGNSVDFTGNSNIAYTRYIDDETQSIIKILNKLNYNTVAIHPYERNFYNRDIVYRKLGIKQFISEESFDNNERIRGFISDNQITDKIIEEYERNKKESDEKFFAHVVTMQNHGPYISSYKEGNIELKSGKLNYTNKDILTEYVNLLDKSDDAFEKLVRYFANIDEPTVIVFYGDHAPILGDNYSVYKELEYISEEFDINDKYLVYNTPFVIWDNYGLGKRSYGDIDASYLGAVLLKELNMDNDIYFNYLYNQIGKIKAYNEDFYIDKNRNIKNNDDMDENELKIVDKMWLLQYDRIFGEKYIDGVNNE